jgi:hypothetical protein
MSGVRVGGVWKQPSQVFVKVAGSWKQVATVHCKVAGVWKQTTLAGPPAVPTLTYSAQNTFTITNYDATLTYTVTGATRTGNQLTAVTNGATIKAAWAPGAPQSAARTMNVLAHGRVLTTVAATPQDTGCGTRPGQCCPSGILNTSGATCSSGPGTLVPDAFCGGSCPGNCFGEYLTCYNWYWTNYTASGYTLIGTVWGKVS